jgi:hypothetical protein
MGPIGRKKLFYFNALEAPIYRAGRLVPRRIKGLLSLINRIGPEINPVRVKLTIQLLTAFRRGTGVAGSWFE